MLPKHGRRFRQQQEEVQWPCTQTSDNPAMWVEGQIWILGPKVSRWDPHPTGQIPSTGKRESKPSLSVSSLSSSQVRIWELGHKESWTPKNWCFQTVVLKTLESPLDCKEIKPVYSKGNQSWIFIGRTDDEAEVLILWPPAVKSWFIEKDPNAGKDWT